MANWYGTARSNYVRVHSYDTMKEVLAPMDIQIVEKQEGDETLYGFLSEDGDSGDFPSGRFVEQADGSEDWEELDFGELVMQFVPEGEVLILMVVGAEKLRYVTGISTAYTWKKKKNGKLELRTQQVSIEDIYHNVAKFWKLKTTQASY